jgi:hypothetical protein
MQQLPWRSWLAILATLCFGFVFIDHAIVHEFNEEDLVLLGLAFFSAAHI